MPVNILVVDDHPIVREGLRCHLGASRSSWAISEASDASSALRQARLHCPDIALVDITMPGESGLEVVRRFARALPELRVIIFTMHGDPEYVVEAIHAGVWGYLLKDDSASELVRALEIVLSGGRFLSERLVGRSDREEAPVRRVLEALTPREREVLELLGNGLSNRDLAARLGVDVRTVETHCSHIKQKVMCRDRNDLVRLAVLLAWRQVRLGESCTAKG